jgi:hypothetical protein
MPAFLRCSPFNIFLQSHIFIKFDPATIFLKAMALKINKSETNHLGRAAGVVGPFGICEVIRITPLLYLRTPFLLEKVLIHDYLRSFSISHFYCQKLPQPELSCPSKQPAPKAAFI